MNVAFYFFEINWIGSRCHNTHTHTNVEHEAIKDGPCVNYVSATDFYCILLKMIFALILTPILSWSYCYYYYTTNSSARE